MRNMVTCVKGVNVLDFFFRNLEPNTHELFGHQAYPFVSPCGRELNFLQPEDTPVVFSELLVHDDGCVLAFAGSLREPFDPERVHLCGRTGRLYHPLTSLPRLGPGALMLLSSKVAVDLGRYIGDTEVHGETLAGSAGMALHWRDGRSYPLQQRLHAEPCTPSVS